MVDWKVFYGDGSTFGSDEGSPADAPATNVQAIAQVSDPAIGRRVCSRFDFYWYEGEWHGGDLFGLYDYLIRVSPSVVKFGRVLPRLAWEAIHLKAVNDPDLPPKVAWDTHEHQ